MNPRTIERLLAMVLALAIAVAATHPGGPRPGWSDEARGSQPVLGGGPSPTPAATCDSIAALFERCGFDRTSRRDRLPGGPGARACDMTFSLAGTDAGEAVRDRLTRQGWREVLERSADGPDGTSFVYRRDMIEIEVRGSWNGGPDAPAPTASDWGVVVYVTGEHRDEVSPGPVEEIPGPGGHPAIGSAPRAGQPEKPLFTDAFNMRLAAAGDSAWAQAPATIAIEFVGGADCECARFSVEVESRPERFDEAEVVVVRDGFLDDSVRGDRHRLVMRREAGIWNLTSAAISWRCWKDRGHEDYSADPCR